MAKASIPYTLAELKSLRHSKHKRNQYTLAEIKRAILTQTVRFLG